MPETTLFGNGEEAKRADIRRGGYDCRHRGFPDYKTRAALLQSNPIEQARGFDRIATAVVELLVGLKLRAGQPGRGATTKSHLPSQQPRGIFLRSKALYGVKEADGRDSLHAHNLISTELDPRILQQFLHEPEFQTELAKVIDSIVVAAVPQNMAVERLRTPGIPRVGLLDAPGHWSHVAFHAAWAQACVSRHEHTYSCHKERSAKQRHRQQQQPRRPPVPPHAPREERLPCRKKRGLFWSRIWQFRTLSNQQL